MEKFEFSSIPEDDLKQKGMIYLGNETFVYVDCEYITYIKIDNEVANVLKRNLHGIPNKITRIKHFQDYHINKSLKDWSNGTLAVLYSMNGYEEFIQLCNLSLFNETH